MRFNLVRHTDGAFALASPKDSTHSLEITDPHYDTGGWWNRDLVVLALARFDSSDVQVLHYHPGRMGSIAHCIFDFGDLLARAGLIVFAGRALRKPSGFTRAASESATFAKSAIYTFRDENHMSEHFTDARKYPQEGYYIGEELILKGKLVRGHFSPGSR